MAANFGTDEVMYVAGEEHLKKLGEIVDEPVEADGDRADMASETEEPTEANACEPFCPETTTGLDCFP
jgi:hypothetical protein